MGRGARGEEEKGAAILRNWFAWFWGLASLKCVGSARGLEAQVMGNIVVLSLKWAEPASRLESQAGFPCCCLLR